MQKISDNTYQYQIPLSEWKLVLSNGEFYQTSDIQISTTWDVSIRIHEDHSSTILRTPGGRVPIPPYTEKYLLSDYRVVGNADWLGNWDPAFEDRRMYNIGEGHYRRNFADVSPGFYEIKITKDGKWDNAYGDHGQTAASR